MNLCSYLALCILLATTTAAFCTQVPNGHVTPDEVGFQAKYPALFEDYIRFRDKHAVVQLERRIMAPDHDWDSFRQTVQRNENAQTVPGLIQKEFALEDVDWDVLAALLKFASFGIYSDSTTQISRSIVRDSNELPDSATRAFANAGYYLIVSGDEVGINMIEALMVESLGQLAPKTFDWIGIKQQWINGIRMCPSLEESRSFLERLLQAPSLDPKIEYACRIALYNIDVWEHGPEAEGLLEELESLEQLRRDLGM